MPAGRPPDPLRLITGTGHRPIPVPATVDPSPIPDCPEYLNATARDVWTYLVDVLEPSKILESSDRYALELLCEAYAEYRDALEHFEASPIVLGSQGQEVRSPWHAVLINARQELRKALNEFGLTPAARVKLGALQKGGEGIGAALAAALSG
jgi:P27 family predicted phage terminase small subunit